MPDKASLYASALLDTVHGDSLLNAFNIIVQEIAVISANSLDGINLFGLHDGVR